MTEAEIEEWADQVVARLRPRLESWAERMAKAGAVVPPADDLAKALIRVAAGRN